MEVGDPGRAPRSPRSPCPGGPSASRARRTRSAGPNPAMPRAPIAARSFMRVVIATRHPSSAPPSRFSSGTRTPEKKTSLKPPPPSICRIGRMSIPSDSMSTMKQVRPRCLGTCGSVRTMMTPHLQKCAPVFQVFCPSRIQPVPSRRARVVRPATSEPAPGSLKSWHQTSSPRAIFLQVPRLLLLRAVLHQGRAEHPDPDREDVGRRAAAKLLLGPDDLLHRSEPAPAVLGRPREAGPSVVELERLPILRAPHRVRVVADERAGRRRAGREGFGVALEEGACLGAELRFGRRVVEVHVGVLLRAESAAPGYPAAAGPGCRAGIGGQCLVTRPMSDLSVSVSAGRVGRRRNRTARAARASRPPQGRPAGRPYPTLDG